MIAFIVIFLPFIGDAQPPVQFTKDSIPIVDGKVAFKTNFKFKLTKTGFHKRADFYLNNVLNPYGGTFKRDNDDSTICQMIDYIGIENGMFQKFGMYMIYRLQLVYQSGTCMLDIRNISYIEKRYFETQQSNQGKGSMPEWSGRDIMINRKYHLWSIKKASEKITDASLKRINEIIEGLYSSFEGK